MRKQLIVFATVITFGCGADSPPRTYSSVRSPSGQSTAIKQYKGDEQILWDLLVIKHESSGDHTIVMLQNQAVRGIWGSDGVVLGWDGDYHLIVGWPIGQQPITGPTKVGDITLTYQAFAPDLDGAAQPVSKETALQDALIDFKEIDSDFGAKYTATGKSVPHIQCVARLRGTDPATSRSIVVEIIGDGMGRRGDPYPSFGMVNVAFTLKGKDDGNQPSLTQAKFGSIYPSFQPDRSPKQSDSSLLYQQYQTTEVLKLFSDIRLGSITIKLSPDFGRSVTIYRISLSADYVLSQVIGNFNKCTATTKLYGAGLHVPTE